MSAPAAAPAAPAVAQGIDELVMWADELETLVRVLTEAGLFQPHTPVEQIIESMYEARELLASGNGNAARKKLANAELLIHQQLTRSGARWRAIHLHRLPLLAYHMAVGLVLLNVATGWWIAGSIATHVTIIPVDVLVLGALGATLRGLYWLHRKVDGRTFRPQFTLSQLAAPAIGALLAALVYLLISTGVVAFSEVTTAPEGTPPLLALAFVAGFSWQWALAQLRPLMEPRAASSSASTTPVTNEPALATPVNSSALPRTVPTVGADSSGSGTGAAVTEVTIAPVQRERRKGARAAKQ